VSRVLLCSGIILTKFKFCKPIRSWNGRIFILKRYVTLWPWPLTRSPWTFLVHQVSRGRSLYEKWAKLNNPAQLLIISQALICSRYVTLWPWPLIPWPWTFSVDGCQKGKPCTEFERNRTIPGWVIYDLAFFKVTEFQTLLVRRESTKLRQTLKEQSSIITAPEAKLW